MDILFLEPIYKKTPWGGDKFGESWEICARKDEANIIVRKFRYTLKSF